jgi:hypothetical protein
MAILPMKQTVTIQRGSTLDDWGNEIPEQSFTLNCRVDEGSSVVVYRSAGTKISETIVATARIFFDKLADIQETDTILFTNELGVTLERQPKEINVKRGVGGKPLLTEVVI